MLKARHISAWLAAAFVSNAWCADWPQFRGADRSDISADTGLLKKWPAAGPKKLWMFDKAGLGYAGFSIVNDVLYTMGGSDEGDEYLYALDVKDGAPKWKTRIGPLLTSTWGDGPMGTPTVNEGRVYALGGKGDLICVSAKDGKEIWHTSLNEHGSKLPSWGYAESVLVDGGNVICTPGGKAGTLLALDKMSGKKVWQSTEWTDDAHYGSAIAAVHNGTRLYIQLTMEHIGGVDAKTGKQLWLSNLTGKTAVIPTPIFKDGKIYVSGGNGTGCKLLDLGANGNPAELWANKNLNGHHGGVILVGDHLYGYCDKGGWTCQDFKTGEVRWAEKKLGKGAIHCADGMLYLLEESTGTVALVEASPNGWAEHGRFKLDPQSTLRKESGNICTHPVVCNGRLYLRDQDLIFCYDVKG